MKLAIMQPYFFPYIGYWQLINAVDHFVIFDDVNYRNRSFINRNYILFNHKPHRITLQLLGASQNRLIKDIEIGDNCEKVQKFIFHAYHNAPFFNQVYPLIESLLSNRQGKLIALLYDSISQICTFLNIETQLSFSSDLDNKAGYRGQARLIDICKRLGADMYVNAIGGRELYKNEAFTNDNIQLRFLRSLISDYRQYDDVFVSNLSIIDVMMFVGIGDLKNMLEDFQLIGTSD